MDTFEQYEATKASVKASSCRTSSRLRYLVPDTPDSTSVVSGWCTYDPERLSSAVYTGTENLRTSSDARSLWQHWREGKRISLSTVLIFSTHEPKHFNTHGLALLYRGLNQLISSQSETN